MFFSKTARILAIVLFVFGLLGFSLGISALAGVMDEAARARYVGKSPWGSVELGIYIILVGVALGTLAEISLSLRKRSTQDAERA